VKIPKLSTVKNKADKIFSEYIRRKNATSFGMCQCVSCGSWHAISECDAGHYISRNHMATRYDERNVHPQCRRCNRFQNGNMSGYSLYMLKHYGETILLELNKLQHTVKKFQVEELQDMIKGWQKELKALRPK